MGIEPMRSDFADHRVSTSPYHHVHQTGKWAKKSSGTRFPELVIPHRQVVRGATEFHSACALRIEHTQQQGHICIIGI
jgi:hypothetical protein